MPDLELDTARIYYERAGSGDPPLVLVHGYTCAHADWNRQVAHFAPRHAVATCDLRAHGKSSGNAQDCTIETYGRDVAALMSALDLSPAVLVGHSMGCRVVLEAYRQAPARVAGLVLIDGSLLGTDPQAADAMRSHMIATGGEAFARALFSEALLPATAEAEQIMQRAVRFPEAVSMRLFPAMIAWEWRAMAEALASVQVPLLAIQSTHLNAERKRVRLEPGQSSPWLDLVRSLVPAARIEIVPGAGHFTMIDAPSVQPAAGRVHRGHELASQRALAASFFGEGSGPPVCPATVTLGSATEYSLSPCGRGRAGARSRGPALRGCDREGARGPRPCERRHPLSPCGRGRG